MGRRSCNYRRIKYIIFRPRANEAITLEIDKQKFTENSLRKLEQLETYNQNQIKEDHPIERPFFPQPINFVQMYPQFIPSARPDIMTEPKHTPPMLRGKKQDNMFAFNNQNMHLEIRPIPNFNIFPIENGNIQMI